MDARAQRQQHLKRYSALKSIVWSSWYPTWRELAEYMAPRRVRFFQSDATTAGRKKEQQIINGTATWALRTLGAGLMAGLTSPARPWFRMTAQDPDVNEQADVRLWLSIVEDRIRLAMLKSNLYQALQVLYADLALFGTGAILLDSDGPGALRAYPMPLGEFVLAQSDRGRVDTFMRETSMTVAQLVKKFEDKPAPGKPRQFKNVSPRVRDLYREGMFDTLIPVLHVIVPREEYDPEASGYDVKNKAYASCWMERDGDVTVGYLYEGGYDMFPVIAPRWTVTSAADAYGFGPGTDALGDVKELQQLERRQSLVAELIADPPLNAPGTFRNGLVSALPGAVNYVDQPGPHNQVVAAYTPDPRAMEALETRKRPLEGRIKTAFFADLLLMLSEEEEGGSPITAREVVERHDEKMTQFGPVIERLEDEALDPMVERYYGTLLEAGALPPPPPSVAKKPLGVEYISIMAQAQKAIAFGGIQQLLSFAGNIAAIRPDVMDKVDIDAVMDEAADSLGVKPNMVVPTAKAQAQRAQRAKAQAQAQQTQNALAATQAAKNLGQANLGGDSALSQVAAAAAGPDGGQ